MVELDPLPVMQIVDARGPVLSPVLADADVRHAGIVNVQASLAQRDDHFRDFFENSEVPGRDGIIDQGHSVVELPPRLGNIRTRIVSKLDVDELAQRMTGQGPEILDGSLSATLYPKRLVPSAKYTVAFRWNKETRTASGAELMKGGIRFSSRDEREMVLLNLDHIPGHGTDRTPPTRPAAATKRQESYGGRTGIAVRWSPSRDDVLVAGYQVLRDGKTLDSVGIGTFYFDAEKGYGLARHYQIVAVDADRNRSAPAAAVQ